MSGLPESLAADYTRWCADMAKRKEDTQSSQEAFASVRAGMLAVFDATPDSVIIPKNLTPEGKRIASFKKVCPEGFIKAISRPLLRNPQAFDSVALWDGSFPGPLACGATGMAKTLGAWSALGRLWTYGNRPFAWFPVRRLILELIRYESHGCADEFFKNYSAPRFQMLFVDDIDKINWQFESEGSALFQFYDWVYRSKIPCITTTNKDRQWWVNKMGEAFARRLFDDAHFHVQF